MGLFHRLPFLWTIEAGLWRRLQNIAMRRICLASRKGYERKPKSEIIANPESGCIICMKYSYFFFYKYCYNLFVPEQRERNK